MSYCEISRGLKMDKFTLHVHLNGSTPRGDKTNRRIKEQGLKVVLHLLLLTSSKDQQSLLKESIKTRFGVCYVVMQRCRFQGTFIWLNNGKWLQCMQIKGAEKGIDPDSNQPQSRGRIVGEGLSQDSCIDWFTNRTELCIDCNSLQQGHLLCLAIKYWHKVFVHMGPGNLLRLFTFSINSEIYNFQVSSSYY